MRHAVRVGAGLVAVLLARPVAAQGEVETPPSEQVQAVVARAVARDALCGSVLERNRRREICSEAGWRTLCSELRRVEPPDTPATGKASAENERDVSFAEIDLQTARFVRRVTRDLLCASEEPDASDESDAPPGRWDRLETVRTHGDGLKRAAHLFADELRRALGRMGSGLADLSYGARIFRMARDRERDLRQRGEDPPEPLRFTGTSGEDHTELFLRSLVERCRRSVLEVREFRDVYAGRRLAELEVEAADARLLNGLSWVAWGVSSAEDSDEVVDVPLWLTGEEPLVPGTETPVPRPPATFLLGTSGSPLDDPTILPDAERALEGFLGAIREHPEEPVGETACAALATALDELEVGVWLAIERSDQADNPAGYRAARSELVRFRVLGTLSRGNQALVDRCGLDRNALEWHRRFLQQTSDLTRDLHPGLGDLLRDLLRNTFSERID